ncbi:MAG: glycosyltransferase family 4 protein [Candidatus Omnitrophica bacterium]|nr:glycosyltransferase family 4 protein [Candidatus Omnitrophota bacterium]
MKIILLANHLNPGGISTYTLTLAEGLKVRGHNVKVVSGGGVLTNRLIRAGIEHIHLDLSTKSELSPKVFVAKRRFLDILSKAPPDILHPQTRLTRVCAQFIRNKTGVPFVSTAHGFYKDRLGNRIFPFWGDGIIAVSEAVKINLTSSLGIPADNIRVIHNGIDTSGKNISDGEKDRIKEKLNLNFNKLIVSISRLSFIKGHIYLVRAMEIVCKAYPSAGCLIVGDGEAKALLEKETRRLKLVGKIKFLSSVEDTGEILSAVDVFVLPTLQEGLGLSILEAMARGIPVVATNVGGIPEIIESGKSGILFPPKDMDTLAEAICRVLGDDVLRNSLVSNAKKIVGEKFSSENMVSLTEDFYKNVTRKFKKQCI